MLSLPFAFALLPVLQPDFHCFASSGSGEAARFDRFLHLQNARQLQPSPQLTSSALTCSSSLNFCKRLPWEHMKVIDASRMHGNPLSKAAKSYQEWTKQAPHPLELSTGECHHASRSGETSSSSNVIARFGPFRQLGAHHIRHLKPELIKADRIACKAMRS